MSIILEIKISDTERQLELQLGIFQILFIYKWWLIRKFLYIRD